MDKILNTYPECKVILYRQALERMLKCNISLARIIHFRKMPKMDKFWRKDTTSDQSDLHQEFMDFLNKMENYKDDLSSG